MAPMPSKLTSYVRTIWLFTYSDMKTIIFPQSILGTILASAACLFQENTIAHETLDLLLFRYPIALFWTWSHLLPFNIFNQLSEDAINEDRINKPWRPLPSGRLNRRQATLMMLAHYLIAIAISVGIGGLRQGLLTIALGAWYNAGGGADNNVLVRNFINAAAYLSFASGAMEVALGSPLILNRPLLTWMCILAAVIFSTVQLQDLFDVEGDASRGRETMPLVLGDTVTRWFSAIMVVMSGIMCPAYWSLDWYGFGLPVLVGLTIAARTLAYRHPRADKRTFLIWNGWLVLIYTLPLVRYYISGCLADDIHAARG
ncbi:UbiA prenyltransferase family-domain-containing protein [Pestalotiopsis sp. NC0098]|nr:UbiA prenyltransferase family-domain-containing protein [Pestalotiopsis sp. NC0098]